MQINKDDFAKWRADRVTLEIMEILRERQNKIAHSLAQGACLKDPEEHGIAVGRYQEIEDLLAMSYEDMLPEEIEVSE